MIQQNWRKTLLDKAKEACKQGKIKETTLGNKIFNDADFFPNLRAGKGCGVDRYIKAMEWFEENQKSILNKC